MGLTTEENIPDMLNVFTSGEDYERIILQAFQLDALDDEGKVPDRGACHGTYSILIDEGNVYLSNGTETRRIWLREACVDLNVLTGLDVIDYFNAYPDKLKGYVDSWLEV